MKFKKGIAAFVAFTFGLSLACRPNLPADVVDPTKCNINFARLETSDDYAKRGNNLMTGGNYNCAINDCQAALDLDPKNDVALKCRGRIRLGRGELAAAQSDFDDVLHVDPSNKFVHRQLSILDQNKKMYDEALAEFALATNGETLTHADYALRAGIYFDKGDFDNANTDYTEAIRLRKEFQDFYLNKDYSRRRTEAITKIASNRAKATQNDAINRLLAIKKELEQPTGNAKK